MSVLREGSGTRWPTLAASAFVVSLIAVTVGLLFWLGGGGKENASAAGGGSTQFSLAQWADVDADWQFGNLNSNNSAYHEGEAIPYLLQVDNADIGAVYEFQLRYDCDKGGVNAFDFLTRYDRDRGTDPATALGLDPASPDATAPINDDPNHAFDASETARTWRVWGATFNSTPTGPMMADGSAPIDCASTTTSDEKRYDVDITATSSTVYLLWGGHLASGFDWGCRPGGTVGECPPVSDASAYCAVSLGACGISGAPFHQAVDVPGTGTGSRDRSIQPGAILPPRQPALVVTKECTAFVQVGETVFWSGTVTNANGIALLNITLTDDNGTPGDTSDDVNVVPVGLTDEDGDTQADDLADGASATWSYSRQVTAGDTDPIVNTIYASAVDAFGRVSSDTASCTTDIIHPDIEVTKSVNPTAVCAGSNFPVLYAFHVINAGDVALTGVTVTDTILGSLTAAFVAANGGSSTLAVGADIAFTAPSNISATTNNTVTAQGNALGLSPADSDSASATVTAFDCDIEVTKSVNPTAVCAGSDTAVTYTFHVINAGTVALTSVTVSDDVLGSLTANFVAANGGSSTLAVGADISFTVPSNISATTNNTVTAQGDALGLSPADSDSASATVTALECSIEVTKQCTSIAQIGDLINVQVTVTNGGEIDLTDIVVNDSHATNLSLVSGDTSNDGVLGTDEVWVYTGSHVAPDAASVTDTVVAEGKDVIGQNAVSDSADCVTVIDHLPVIEIEKSVDGSDPDDDFSDEEATAVGSIVTYKVVIDNDSSEPVTITSLLDDTYAGIVCRDSDGDDVIGQTLAADDGDGAGSMNGGPDEVTCTFKAQAPSTEETTVTDIVTVEVMDEQENTASGQDDAAIRTLPEDVLGPTPTPSPTPSPTPVVSPAVLPPTGGLGALTEEGSVVVMFVLLGLGLVVGGAWIIWSSRRWDSRRGSGS
ncbi:MAG: hypothetical protein Q7R32_02190 [Dehalococcoidia bacterium]|nr:hypothetical protein [Dehalococcoidia bacterium]